MSFDSSLNITLDSNHDAVFNVSGNERLRIDSLGNVGIGTTSPGSKLHIKDGPICVERTFDPGNDNGEAGLVFKESGYDNCFYMTYDAGGLAGTDNEHLTFYNSGSSGANPTAGDGNPIMTLRGNGYVGIGTTSPVWPLHIHTPSIDTQVQLILTNSTTGTSTTNGTQIMAYQSDTYITNRENGAIYFRNNSTNTRMTISSIGYVGIGTTNPSSLLHVNGNITASTVNATLTGNVTGDVTGNVTGNVTGTVTGSVSGSSGSVSGGSVSASTISASGRIQGSAGMYISGSWDTIDYGNLESDYWTLQNQIQGDPPSYSFSLHADNAIEAQAIVVTSDRRIKDNIEEIKDDLALQQLRQLRPSTYTYKDTYTRGSDPVIGFIAQEVREVLPYAVKNKTGAIPNILKPGIAHIMENNITELRLKIPLDDDMQLTNTSLIKLNVNNRSIEVEVVSCPNKNVIEIVTHESITHEDVIVVYGEIVEDFHCLNKSSIFTVATAALQEVDRQLQTEKTKVATLETQLADVLQRLTNANI